MGIVTQDYLDLAFSLGGKHHEILHGVMAEVAVDHPAHEYDVHIACRPLYRTVT